MEDRPRGRRPSRRDVGRRGVVVNVDAAEVVARVVVGSRKRVGTRDERSPRVVVSDRSRSGSVQGRNSTSEFRPFPGEKLRIFPYGQLLRRDFRIVRGNRCRARGRTQPRA